jgi:NADH-quinone oxidoreductase subunit G
LGSDNIDYRLRNAEFPAFEGVRYLGTSIASLSTLQRVLIVGSHIRKDHPLFAQRIRQAARKGCTVTAINSVAYDWAMPVANSITVPAAQWAQALADVAAAIAADKGVPAPAAGNATDAAKAVAKSLLGGERKAVLLGNAAAHHGNASSLLALAQWIGEHTGATVGYLTEAANTVGAQVVGAQPLKDGKTAAQMLAGGLRAAIVLNTEPKFDSASRVDVKADMVITLSPFKANMDCSDVLLPIAPFTETAGTFINAEGRVQSFHGVVRPLGETRPAWKVLRVLGNMLGVAGFDFESSQEVLAKIIKVDTEVLSAEKLSNTTKAAIRMDLLAAEPANVNIYQLDSIVRRAPSLQLTSDAKVSSHLIPVAREEVPA